MSKCIVKGCKNSGSVGFLFPAQGTTLQALWIASLEKHQKVPENYIDYIICSLHFNDSDFVCGNRESMQLMENAVPKIFPASDLDSLPSPGQHGLLKDEPVDIEDLPHNVFLDTDDDSSSDLDRKDIQAFFTHVKNEIDLAERSEDMDTYESIDWEEDSESDYESVSETDVTILKENVRKKTEELKRSENTMQSMLEMIRKQEESISKLEVELEALLKANECKAENEEINDGMAKEDDSEGSRAKQPRIEASSNFYLQSFSMSLYYFSPNVYAYVRSLIPQLPSQSDIRNWVKNGQASEIFPPGVLDFDKISLD